MHSSATDTALVSQVARGDLEAFGALIERHRQPAFAVALACLGDVDDAQDAVQDAFVDAYLGIQQLRDAQRFRAWLMTILRRRCMGMLRERYRNAQIVTRESERVVHGATIARREDDVGLRLALASLPQGEHRALMLRYEGYTYEEIALRLQVSADAVRSRLHRARAHLQKEVLTMSDEHTRDLVTKTIERLLLRLAGTPGASAPEMMQRVASDEGDAAVSEMAKGLGWIMGHGEPLERAFILTGALPLGIATVVRLGHETGRDAAALKVASQLLGEGLLVPGSPVSSEDAATLLAYLSSLMQIGVPLVQAFRMSGKRVPALAEAADAVAESIRTGGPVEDACAKLGAALTKPVLALLVLGAETGRLEVILSLLAAMLWEPSLLDTRKVTGDWQERMQRAEEILRVQGKIPGGGGNSNT